MREIKFRVWDKTRNEMKDDVTIEFMNNLSVTLNGFLTHNIINTATKIMQFTGLKDKNGKEIYEGDIVKVDEGVFQVIFNDCGFELKTTGNRISLYYGIEVIGNIYENPELLGDKE